MCIRDRGLHGLQAQVEILGDPAVFMALAYAAEDLELAVGEAVHRGARGSHPVSKEFFRRLRRDHRAHIEPAAEDLAKGRQDLARGLPLHDIAEGAGPQGALRIERLVVHREHEHGRRAGHGLHPLDEVQPRIALQREVDDHGVRPGSLDSGVGLGGPLGLRAHAEVGLLIDQLGQSLPDEGMIVHQEDPPARRGRGGGGGGVSHVRTRAAAAGIRRRCPPAPAHGSRTRPR